MAEYIKKEAAIDAIYRRRAWEYWEDILRSLPPADVVTRDCYDRILWENDVMKEQLASIGKKFGEKMDGVRLVRRGRWEDCSSGWMCSNCSWTQIRESHYCPNCGADMRGSDVDGRVR